MSEEVGPPASSGETRLRILKMIRESPDGMTCEQVEDGGRMLHQTASARIRELVQDGLLVWHDFRENRSGRKARIYTVTRKKPDAP
jgi:predicted ArsR family transcriptional regulator